MILGIGADVLDVDRMARELRKGDASFRDAVFTPAEIAHCEARAHPERHFAARFAAKEALFKALSGDGPSDFWLDVEVEGGAGAPRLVLTGRTREAADRLGVRSALVSVTTTAALAAATVVLEG